MKEDKLIKVSGTLFDVDKDEDKMAVNNPKNEASGHHTGRCGHCGSRDLWDDNLAYGCNTCGKLLATN